MTTTTVALAAVGLSGVIAAQPTTAAPLTTSSFGQPKCSHLTNGDLCATGISGTPDGYDAAYNKLTGPPVTVRFFLECMNDFRKSDNGAFTISAGQRRSFVFSVGNRQECRVRMHDFTNDGDFRSPYVVIP